VRPRPWLDHYDYWVPRQLTFPGRPLSEILDTTAVEAPDAKATWFLGAELSYGEIKSRSDRFARALAAQDIGKGDRVAIMLPNCPQYIVAAFAILRLGAVVVNVNPTFTPPEILHIIKDSGARAMLTLDRLAPIALGLCEQSSVTTVIVTSLAEYSSDGGPPPVVEGAQSFTGLIEFAASGDVPRPSITSDDLAVLQYTGGTTGTPKGAILTHGNIFANVIQHATWRHPVLVRGDARYLLVIPFFHIYAFTVGMMCGTWIGALQILIPKYDVDQVLTAIRDLRPTSFPAVPTIFVSLLSHPRVTEYGLEKVRLFNSGSAPCPLEVIEEFERRIGRTLNEGYGLSETSPVTHSTPLLAKRKPGTVGLPLPGTDIKVVDVETGGRELSLGEAGELCISGPQVMKGYWNRPDDSAQALRADADGHIWFHTGDIARIDEDGFTTIVARKKDLIIVDGFNVYPADVETVLYKHPAVKLAAVVGVPHPYHGETVRACIVLHDGMRATADDLRAHCAESLAEYKRPLEYEFRDTLPTSAVGKILYRVLRDEIARSTPAAEKR
jgi:long-chain acyl-CoA synthetase